jgi:hypothetical protein
MPIKKELFAISRRVLFGAAGAAPLLTGTELIGPSHDVIVRCDEWLALDARIDRLCLRWSDLESVLAREKNWSQMSPDERQALSPTEEMAAIDEQLKGLFEQRRQRLDVLPTLPAHDMRGVTGKLAVAVQMMRPQRNDGYELIESATREMQGMRCAHCGAPVVGK